MSFNLCSYAAEVAPDTVRICTVVGVAAAAVFCLPTVGAAGVDPGWWRTPAGAAALAGCYLALKPIEAYAFSGLMLLMEREFRDEPSAIVDVGFLFGVSQGFVMVLATVAGNAFAATGTAVCDAAYVA